MYAELQDKDSRFRRPSFSNQDQEKVENGGGGFDTTRIQYSLRQIMILRVPIKRALYIQ